MHNGLTEVGQGVDMIGEAGQVIQRMRDGANRVVQVVQQLSSTVSQAD